MTLATLKTQVYATFPGKAVEYVNGWVKENYGDLRKKATWEAAASDRGITQETQPVSSPTTKKRGQQISQDTVDECAAMLYALPDKIEETVTVTEISETPLTFPELDAKTIDSVDVICAEIALTNLPLRKITSRDGTVSWIFDRFMVA